MRHLLGRMGVREISTCYTSAMDMTLCCMLLTRHDWHDIVILQSHLELRTDPGIARSRIWQQIKVNSMKTDVHHRGVYE